ncbi:DsbA family protein [Lichenibacterium dinghuense]|uniref:DsbA family protein n=1 Tax=Lichenibacterium dinghuense TaxID=2895977 RepID=UPI001F008997|nr:DsbA family protein [Lichenibacterium sp. 6Y81]
MVTDRRGALRAALALAGAAALPRLAAAQAGSLFPFTADDGKQVYNYRLPSDLSVEGLPGVVWTGAKHPDVILVEYFDYNCPFCRKAEADIDGLLRMNPGLRLGLVNDPILSLSSVQAAKVQQAVLRTAGPAKAYAFHQAVYAKHGPIDGPLALQVVGEMGLDARAIEAAADLPQVAAVVKRQAELASSLGFEATPSFSLGNIGILGYPGPDALQKAIADMKRCDKLACG